jgi:hypothetical protein
VPEEHHVGVEFREVVEGLEGRLPVFVEAVLLEAGPAGRVVVVLDRIAGEQDPAILEQDRAMAGRVAGRVDDARARGNVEHDIVLAEGLDRGDRPVAGAADPDGVREVAEHGQPPRLPVETVRWVRGSIPPDDARIRLVNEDGRPSR